MRRDLPVSQSNCVSPSLKLLITNDNNAYRYERQSLTSLGVQHDVEQNQAHGGEDDVVTEKQLDP